MQNPSLAISMQDARRELARMAAEPKRAPRPVVVLDGYLSPHFGAWAIGRALGRVLVDTPIVRVSYPLRTSFERCRRKVVRRVRQACAVGQAPLPEVDVVGWSMGGLIARYAALPEHGNERLRIGRLFTLGTPHRGARMAGLACVHPMQRDMIAGSPRLRDLDAQRRAGDYELLPYTRLNDRVVGEANTAPPGELPWWVDNPRGQLAHMMIIFDARVLLDIARRLRGEDPLATEPRTALPG